MLSRFADAALTRSEMKNVKGGLTVCSVSGNYYNYLGKTKVSEPFQINSMYCALATEALCQAKANNMCKSWGVSNCSSNCRPDFNK